MEKGRKKNTEEKKREKRRKKEFKCLEGSILLLKKIK